MFGRIIGTAYKKPIIKGLNLTRDIFDAIKNSFVKVTEMYAAIIATAGMNTIEITCFSGSTLSISFSKYTKKRPIPAHSEIIKNNTASYLSVIMIGIEKTEMTSTISIVIKRPTHGAITFKSRLNVDVF